ncbi:tripartite motif-containing protein 46-like [Mytilus trossulus]|uniref:tripartite motif-containing protein 46-like n=1 Tax=Mytilus trossulus TaxID=6551 RepID=UPI0030077E57
MAFSQSIRKSQTPINCQLCETDKFIKWKCIECNLLMCYNCRDKIHPKFRNATDHKIVDIKDIGQQNEELDFTNIKCIEHSEQFYCLFCKKCENLVCPTCVSKVHKVDANDLIEIREAYDIEIDRLNKETSQMYTAKLRMANKKDILERLIAEQNSTKMKVRQDILSHKSNLIKIVDKYFESLEMELDSSYQSFLEPIEHGISAIIKSSEDIENKKGKLKDVMNATDVITFFQEIKKIEKVETEPGTRISTTNNALPKFIPGEITQANVGVLQSDERKSTELSVDMVINKTHQTDLSTVTYLYPSIHHEKSMWIACSKDKVLKKVRPEKNKLKVIFSINTTVYGIAVLPSNDVLLSSGRTTLQQLRVTTGKLTDSSYNVDPLLSTGIHITSSNKVVVGGYHGKLGRQAVFVINNRGVRETVYEYDQLVQVMGIFMSQIVIQIVSEEAW